MFSNMVSKVRKSIEMDDQNINHTDPEKLVKTYWGEIITWSESVRRVNPKPKKSELEKHDERVDKYQRKIDRTKYPRVKIDTSRWPKFLMVN